MDHIPVLLPEVLEYLHLPPNGIAIDATLGGGGHTRALLDAVAPNGTVIGFEADARTLEQTQTSLSSSGRRFVPVHANFRNLITHLPADFIGLADGLLFDLGLSSIALNDAARGFSFQHDGPLDMRLDPKGQTLTAADLINTWSAQQLAECFRELGEERAAVRIAQHLVLVRAKAPFARTLQLADAIATVVPRRGRLHPATKVFQALRLAVNDELGALRDALPQALSVLSPRGRLAVITFHSLEDRLVKLWSKAEAAKGKLRIVNKHVIIPNRQEILTNPRARSAKLRVMEKNS